MPITISTWIWRNKLSGPLLDRLDLQVEVPRLAHRELTDPSPGEASAVVRARVETARLLQRERFQKEGVHCNARMRPRHLQRFCRPDAAGQALLEKVTDRLGLSARSYTRILKVARTIADLAGSEQVTTTHLAEAIQYRSLDRRVP